MRNWVVFLSALVLLLVLIGAGGLVAYLFATGQAVNAILIGFVGFGLGQLFNMVSHALGFNQALNVTPLDAAPTVPAPAPMPVEQVGL